MTLVAGIDSSTQSCKVVVRDATDGRLVREGRAPHPDGTEVDPEAWWSALGKAAAAAGGLDDVAAVSVGAQQHGMVCLDERAQVVRPALLWNDTRSAADAEALVEELGPGVAGARSWAEAVGSVPLAAFTVTKLRWLARARAGARPGDRRGLPAARLADLAPRRGPPGGRIGRPAAVRRAHHRSRATRAAPATGRPSPASTASTCSSEPSGTWRACPESSARRSRPGMTLSGALLGPGTGDNAAAALGVGAGPGDVVVSIGTSGTVFAVCESPVADPSGIVAGFADATGRFLPLVCTLNAARVLDAMAAVLGVGPDELSRLALSAPPGADGLVLVPYLEGERTPNRPDATGAVHGLRLARPRRRRVSLARPSRACCAVSPTGSTPSRQQGVRIDRVLLVGGGSRSEAVRRIAPAVLGHPVLVPPPGEYVADGAAKQAAWVALGGAAPPRWPVEGEQLFEAEPTPEVRERYAEVRDLTARRHDR